jgi:hypothetical protein
MLPIRRIDVGSVSVGLVLASSVAGESVLAGFSSWIAATVGVATLLMCSWACLTES